MNFLAIETSTERASVALLGGEQIWCEEQNHLRQHAQFLLPMIDSVLEQASVKLGQLDGIAFGAGPGSFTGLRIACSIAKGLAYAHDLPLYPISSLASIACSVAQMEQASAIATQVLVMIDARMQQVYWDCFEMQALLQGDFTHKAQVSNPLEIKLINSGPCVLAGVGLELYAAALPKLIQEQIQQQYSLYPHAREMLAMLKQGRIDPISAAMALPTYVRNNVTQGASHG